MARTARILVDDGFYHLIARGNNKKPVFDIAGGFSRFKEVLMLSKEKFDWDIFHYCLMPNHVHILARVAHGKDLSLLMKFNLQSYSKWYRCRVEYTGYLWQGRFKSPLIEDESYLLQCGRYIEKNPVRAGLSARPEEYSWSSHRHYSYGQYDPLVTDDPSYQGFGMSPLERQRNYREFVSLDQPNEELVEQSLVARYF
jgi:putative transposase